MARADYFAWVKVYSRVNEECVADAIAGIVLARGGFKPNETADYIVHYSCDEWWVEQYGADHLAEVTAQCLTAHGIVRKSRDEHWPRVLQCDHQRKEVVQT